MCQKNKKNSMEVNCSPQLGYKYSTKYCLCSAEERNSYKYDLTDLTDLRQELAVYTISSKILYFILPK